MPPTYLRFSCRIASQIPTDDVHIKYFHRRQSPACLSAKLNSAQLRRQAGGQCLGQNVSAINVHICRSVAPGQCMSQVGRRHMRTRLNNLETRRSFRFKL